NSFYISPLRSSPGPACRELAAEFAAPRGHCDSPAIDIVARLGYIVANAFLSIAGAWSRYRRLRAPRLGLRLRRRQRFEHDLHLADRLRYTIASKVSAASYSTLMVSRY